MNENREHNYNVKHYAKVVTSRLETGMDASYGMTTGQFVKRRCDRFKRVMEGGGKYAHILPWQARRVS
jgi:hypothetical protein